MVWNAPKTWASNDVLTALDMNTYLRDNMNLTCPAVAEKENQYFVAAGENIVAAREYGYRYFDAVESTTSTSYADLGTFGPSVEVETGPGGAICMWAVQVGSVSATSLVSVEITGDAAGDSDAAAADERALTATNAVYQAMNVVYYTDLTPGTNTFTLKYRVSSGTSKFRRRRILVLPL